MPAADVADDLGFQPVGQDAGDDLGFVPVTQHPGDDLGFIPQGQIAKPPPSLTPASDAVVAATDAAVTYGSSGPTTAEAVSMERQFATEHPKIYPWLVGAKNVIAGSIPKSLEEARQMVKPPIQGAAGEENVQQAQEKFAQDLQQWGEQVRGEHGPVAQAETIIGAAVQAAPLLHLPFAKSPIRAPLQPGYKLPPPPEVPEAAPPVAGTEGYARVEPAAPEVAPRAAEAVPPTPEGVPEAITAPPIEPEAAPAVTLTERTLPEGDVTGTHAVDITNPEGTNIGYIGGSVTPEGFEVNISHIDKGERGKGYYQDAIQQMADKYGQVKSDTDLAPAAETAWQKVGAEKQADSSYVLRKEAAPVEEAVPTTPEAPAPPRVAEPPQGGGETPTLPITDTEPHISAIANRYVTERAKAGEIGEIAPGQGYSTRDLATAGLQMPPETVAQHVSDLMQGKGNPIEQGKAVRAEEARLSQRSNQASRLAESNPTVENRLAANAAFNDLTDFHKGPVAKLKTVFHATGVGLQGELPVDLSTFNGLREKWLKDTGEAPPASAEPLIKKTAREVAQAVESENGARAKLSQEVEKATRGRKLPTADEVRNNIRERMGLGPCKT